MVGGRQRRGFRDAERDVLCAHASYVGLDAGTVEQGGQEERHAFAVAVAFAQSLGRSVRPECRLSFFICYIADIVLYE